MLKKIILPASLIILYLIIISRPVQNAIWTAMAFFNPRLSSQMDEEWKDKPNKFLLRQLHSNSFMHSGTAAKILIERRDKTLVPEFIKLLKSRNPKTRGTAIRALGKINDNSVIPYLMEYVKRGPENIHYRTALLALAEMKYEPVIPDILQLADTHIENDDRPQQYAIEMMSNFDNPKIDEKLKELLNHESAFVRGPAKIAIEKIRARREIQE
jgi:HEAT repeat protein